MNQSITTRLSNALSYVAASIIILLPFNEFFTTWLGSNFGHLNVLHIWVDLIILLAVIPLGYIVIRTPKLKKWLLQDRISRLILIYVFINLFCGFWAYKSGRVNATALVAGLIIDLQFFAFFVFTIIVSSKSQLLKENWQKLILIPATIVIAFGLAQLFLALDFLKHFGYGPNTIPAYETVDQKAQYHRIQSTLRGANPFGAYLVLIINTCFIALKKNKVLKITLAIFSIIALYFTYSRSAYLGLVISLFVLYYLIKLNPKWKKQFIIICLVVLAIFSGLILTLRYNSYAQNVLFHTDSSSRSHLSSNAQRLGALQSGLKEVEINPLGQGPGTAGPASEHNNHPPRIAENYYIQVAQETGVIGLFAFLAINTLIIVRLWRLQKDPLASLLIASFIGISIINLMSHAWADSTLSLLWWGLAGVVLSPAIIKKNK